MGRGLRGPRDRRGLDRGGDRALPAHRRRCRPSSTRRCPTVEVTVRSPDGLVEVVVGGDGAITRRDDQRAGPRPAGPGAVPGGAGRGHRRRRRRRVGPGQACTTTCSPPTGLRAQADRRPREERQMRGPSRARPQGCAGPATLFGEAAAGLAGSTPARSRVRRGGPGRPGELGRDAAPAVAPPLDARAREARAARGPAGRGRRRPWPVRPRPLRRGRRRAPGAGTRRCGDGRAGPARTGRPTCSPGSTSCSRAGAPAEHPVWPLLRRMQVPPRPTRSRPPRPAPRAAAPRSRHAVRERAGLRRGGGAGRRRLAGPGRSAYAVRAAALDAASAGRRCRRAWPGGWSHRRLRSTTLADGGADSPATGWPAPWPTCCAPAEAVAIRVPAAGRLPRRRSERGRRRGRQRRVCCGAVAAGGSTRAQALRERWAADA